VSDLTVRTVADLLKKPVSLIVNRDDNGHAEGLIFLD